MSSRSAKKISRRAEELSMALLKEHLSAQEAAKVTKSSVSKTEYAPSDKGTYALTMSTKGMKSVLKKLAKTKPIETISLIDVKNYCVQVGRG